MARILITGSADGIGLAAAKLLVSQGHQVTLHARNEARAKAAKEAEPAAAGVLIGDLTSISGTKALAEAANAAGPWDAVVHNAGIGPRVEASRTADGLAATFAVNTLAPYVLTALMARPKRLLYLSSSMHYSGEGSLKDAGWTERKWDAHQAYCDSKLQDSILAAAVARRWGSEVQSCSLDPGWIQTKMGGGSAPGVVATPAKAIADFAVGKSELVGDKSGLYFNPQEVKAPHKDVESEERQEALLKLCKELSGVELS